MSSPKVAQILAARNKRRFETKGSITEEMKLKWKEQEPSEKQVEFLLKAKVPADQINMMSKYDASEMIEKIQVEREARNAGPATPAQVRALELWGFTQDELAGLTYAEAREIFNGLPKKK